MQPHVNKTQITKKRKTNNYNANKFVKHQNNSTNANKTK